MNSSQESSQMNSTENSQVNSTESSTDNSQSNNILCLLNNLTQALKAYQLWQESQPSVEKLASTLPFCYDTLVFEQWLQFIFIPKMLQMINEGLPLPTAISLTPMAEEAFKGLNDQGKGIIQIILAIDDSLSKKSSLKQTITGQ